MRQNNKNNKEELQKTKHHTKKLQQNGQCCLNVNKRAFWVHTQKLQLIKSDKIMQCNNKNKFGEH